MFPIVCTMKSYSCLFVAPEVQEVKLTLEMFNFIFFSKNVFYVILWNIITVCVICMLSNFWPLYMFLLYRLFQSRVHVLLSFLHPDDSVLIFFTTQMLVTWSIWWLDDQVDQGFTLLTCGHFGNEQKIWTSLVNVHICVSVCR